MLNVDELIDEVYNNKCIWDKKDPNHYNAYHLNLKWREIGKALNISKTVVQAKWKSLRDKYRKDLYKISQSQSEGRCNEQVSSWRYFDQMMFLKDQFDFANSTNDLVQNQKYSKSTKYDHNMSEISLTTIKNECYDYECNEINMEDTYNNMDQNYNALEESSTFCTAEYKRNEGTKSPSPTFRTASLDLDKSNLENLKCKDYTESDEDLYFFKSIIPHIKNFSSLDKLKFRSRVIELVTDTIEEMTTKEKPLIC